jgi:hypothetical protein
MLFFHHPNPAKLAANNDLHGLVECVTGKDQAIARQAAPLLAALVDDFDEAPGTHEVLRDLEGDAQPMAVYALGCVLRHDFGRNSHVKSSAALALYRLHAFEDLKKVLQEVRASEHAGGPFHASLSHDLLGAALRAHDLAMLPFALVHGQFAEAREVVPALEALSAAGGSAIAAVAEDSATFSAAVREAAQGALGRTASG